MSQHEGSVPNSGKLVMIVDDDDSVLDLLEFVVKKEGFRSERASDGEEALRKIQAHFPDLILLDLMLPRYGGFELLRHLQGGETVKIPIIVITGRYTDRTTMEMIRQESNVMDFMLKPIKPPALALALHKILKSQPAQLSGEESGGQ